MVPLIELLSVLLITFGFNIIPFAGPSNLLIASNAAVFTSSLDPLTIGLLVAIGATLAKLIHYVVTFFVGGHLGAEKRTRLSSAAGKLRGWAFLALFIAAATPIPDEPVVIPLGLMKYNPAKFTLAYFVGKLAIAIPGAFLGGFGSQFLGGYMSQTTIIILSIILSIALTIVFTVILLKVDLQSTAKRFVAKLDERRTETKTTDKKAQD